MKEEEASSTAYTVLMGMLYTAQRPGYSGLVPEEVREACRKILSSSERGRQRLDFLGKRWFLMVAPLIEWLTMPGICLHYVLRKKYIEDKVEEGLKEGFTQIINLGAGFDTLAYRLSEKYPQVRFIEIDHPATHKAKAQALAENVEERENLKLLSVDLAQHPLEEALNKFEGFDPDRPTLYICEGVLTYLQESDVVQLFTYLKNLTREKIRFIFTATETMERAKNSFGVITKLYLIFKGEPLQWVKSSDTIGEFVEAQDFSSDAVATCKEMGELYLPQHQRQGLHSGEYVAVATYKK